MSACCFCDGRDDIDEYVDKGVEIDVEVGGGAWTMIATTTTSVPTKHHHEVSRPKLGNCVVVNNNDDDDNNNNNYDIIKQQHSNKMNKKKMKGGCSPFSTTRNGINTLGVESQLDSTLTVSMMDELKIKDDVRELPPSLSLEQQHSLVSLPSLKASSSKTSKTSKTKKKTTTTSKTITTTSQKASKKTDKEKKKKKDLAEVEEEILECDFDSNPTDLILSIQRKNWKQVGNCIRTKPKDVKTWIVRKSLVGKQLWRLLPIHAAIASNAPEYIIRWLLKTYPNGASSLDDQGMSPLHLSLFVESPQNIIAIILAACPESIHVKDCHGRTPKDVEMSKKINENKNEMFLQSMKTSTYVYVDT